MPTDRRRRPALARRILHPSDFSSASRPAFTRAVALARGAGAELLLVHALDVVVPLGPDGYISPRVWDDLLRSARTAARKRLDRLAARARAAGVRVATLLVEGQPYQAITRAARGRRADLIVMGTHGRSGLSRLFLGSVAGRVVATAPCPVLTVKDR